MSAGTGAVAVPRRSHQHSRWCASTHVCCPHMHAHCTFTECALPSYVCSLHMHCHKALPLGAHLKHFLPEGSMRKPLAQMGVSGLGAMVRLKQ